MKIAVEEARDRQDSHVGTEHLLLALLKEREGIAMKMLRELGLTRRGTKRVTSSAGPTEAGMYDAVRLTIQDRSCTMDVIEVPDDVPVLIGQIPLEHLDLVVDLRSRTLIGNPAHGGEHTYEMY